LRILWACVKVPLCVCQALDLDRRNVDAWVARGAAYANQHAFPKAVSDFQTALGVRHYEAAQHTVQGPCTCVFCCCTAAYKPDAAVTQQMLAISVVMCFCTAGHEGLSHNCSHNCSSILYTKLPFFSELSTRLDPLCRNGARACQCQQVLESDRAAHDSTRAPNSCLLTAACTG